MKHLEKYYPVELPKVHPNQAMEQSTEFQQPPYMAFVDFKRVFDSLDHQDLWNIILNLRILTKILNIIKELYADATYCKLHTGKHQTE